MGSMTLKVRNTYSYNKNNNDSSNWMRRWHRGQYHSYSPSHEYVIIAKDDADSLIWLFIASNINTLFSCMLRSFPLPHIIFCISPMKISMRTVCGPIENLKLNRYHKWMERGPIRMFDKYEFSVLLQSLRE